MRAASVACILAIFVVSAYGAAPGRASSSQSSTKKVDSSSTVSSSLSSSQIQQLLQSFNSSGDLAALLSKLNSTGVTVTVTTTEDTTEDTTSGTFSDTTEDSSSTTDTFVQDLLTAHNAYRVIHGVANLTLNSTLSAYALEWAQYLADNSLFEHRTNPIYGENLFWSSAATTAQAAVDAWYSEISDYTDYTTEPDLTSFTSGHFTQAVWKGSEQLGCGSVTCSSGAVYVVCNYNPPGNYVGEFVANVLAPSS